MHCIKKKIIVIFIYTLFFDLIIVTDSVLFHVR